MVAVSLPPLRWVQCWGRSHLECALLGLFHLRTPERKLLKFHWPACGKSKNFLLAQILLAAVRFSKALCDDIKYQKVYPWCGDLPCSSYTREPVQVGTPAPGRTPPFLRPTSPSFRWDLEELMGTPAHAKLLGWPGKVLPGAGLVWH